MAIQVKVTMFPISTQSFEMCSKDMTEQLSQHYAQGWRLIDVVFANNAVFHYLERDTSLLSAGVKL